MPVKVVEPLPDLSRKFFEPADDQGQLTFRRGRIESGLPALPELCQAAFEAGDAGLELATLGEWVAATPFTYPINQRRYT